MADVIQAQDTKATNQEIAAVLSEGAGIAPGFSVDTEFVQKVVQELNQKGGKTALETLANAQEMIQRRKYQGEHFTPQTEAKKYSSETDPGLEGRIEQRMSEISLVQVGLELIARGYDLKSGVIINYPEVYKILEKYGLASSSEILKNLRSAGDIIKKAMLILVNEPLLRTYLAGLSSLGTVDAQAEWLAYICRKLPTFSDNLAKAIGEWKDKYREVAKPEDRVGKKSTIVKGLLVDEINPSGKKGSLEKFIIANNNKAKPTNDQLIYIYRLLKKGDSQSIIDARNYIKSTFNIDLDPTSPTKIVEDQLMVFQDICDQAAEVGRLEKPLTAEEAQVIRQYENDVRSAETDLNTIIAQAFVETYRDIESEITQAKTQYNQKKSEEAARAAQEAKDQETKKLKLAESDYYINLTKRWIEEGGRGIPKRVFLDVIRGDLMIIKNYGERGVKYLVASSAGILPGDNLEYFDPNTGRMETISFAKTLPQVPEAVERACQERYGFSFNEIVLAKQNNDVEFFIKLANNSPLVKNFIDANPKIISEHVSALLSAYNRAETYLNMGPLTRAWYFRDNVLDRIRGRATSRALIIDGNRSMFSLTHDEVTQIASKFGKEWLDNITKDNETRNAVERILESRGLVRGTPDFNRWLTLILMLLGGWVGAGAGLALFGILGGLGGSAILGSSGAVGGRLAERFARI